MIGRRESRVCRRARRRLTLLHYGAVEGAERAALERHLEACSRCAAEWASTRRALAAVGPGAAFPEEAGVDWGRLARDTVARARAAEARAAAASRPAARHPAPGWLALAAAAAVVAAGLILLERPWGHRDADRPALAVSADAARFLQEAAVRQGAARYLRDSRTLLVDLLRSPVPCRREGAGLDVALEKERSRSLLRRKNLALGSLGGPRDQRLVDLVAQLESLLLQVSALDDCTAARQIHDLRVAIESRQLLLRIDLVTRQMEEGALRV